MNETTFSNVRVTSKEIDGRNYSGIYYPAHEKNGITNSARFEFAIAENKRGFFNQLGVWVEGKTEFYNNNVWNGKNSLPGKGRADIAAKSLSIGKGIQYMRCDLHPYEQRLFENRQPVLSAATNQPIMVGKISFTLNSRIEYGQDSFKTIANEIGGWVVNVYNFESRPLGWRNTPEQDAQSPNKDGATWKAIKEARKAAEWDGASLSYGFAKVMIPAGAQVLGFNQPPQNAPPATPPVIGQQNLGPAPGTPPVAAANQLNQQPMTATPGLTPF